MNTPSPVLPSDLLDKVQHILNDYPARPVTILVPNQLFRLWSRQRWPEHTHIRCHTASEYLRLCSNLASLHPLEWLKILYSIHRKIYPYYNEDFVDFAPWGQRLLDDFDEVDRNLVNPGLLFWNLKNYHEFDQRLEDLPEETLQIVRRFWTEFSRRKDGEEIKRFSRIWENLLSIYEALRAEAIQRGAAWDGLAMRLAVENDCCPRPSDRHTLFIVAGFSAASRAELNLFDKLKALGALFLYDADPWYVYPETGRLAEAGDYLRLLIQRYPPAIPPSDTLSRPRNIHLIAVPGHSFMAYKAAQLAHQKARALIVCGSTDTLEKLSQYHDLFIPQPDLRARLLRKMDIPGFCSLALRLYNDYTSKNKKALRKDYCVALLHHPLPQQFAPAWQSLKAHWEAELKEHPYPVVTTDFLLNKVPHAQWLVEALDDPQPLGSCIKMLQSLGLANEEETLTKRTIEALTFLQDVDSSLNVEEKRLERYVQLFLQYEYGQLANEQPVLSELPVVTLLTGSRALSFETVILTDFNDGVFPDTTPQPSVIPYSLRRAFGLPTNADRVSEQMYLFYRLLHSAKDIYLLYNTQQDVDCQPVPSLVYYQLKSELNGYAFYNTAEPIVPLMIRTAPIKVTKTSEILQKIQNLLTSPQGLSPSALITYLNCPLKFYFQYIAQLREPEKAEDLGPANFGNLFHKLMEGLYNHFLGQKVTKSQLEALRPLIPGLAEQVILEAETGERKAGYSKKGKWLLLRTALIQSAQSVLEYDLERCHQSFTIRYLEWDNKNAPRTIDLKANSECSFARFSGRIDRIDEIQDGYYLIDYKTGKTDKNQFDHEVAFDITIDSPNRDYSVQLYMYAWFFEPNTSEGETLSPWVYSIRSFHGTEAKQLSLEDFRKMEIGNVRPYLADFTNQVKNVTLQLLDADLPFIQTKNRKKCSNCEFNFICKR